MPLRADPGGSSLRGLASTALLLLGILLFLTTGMATPAQGARLAGVAVAALLWRGLMASRALQRSLGAFATAFDLAIGLGLVLITLRLTGGLGSELYTLVLVDLVLAQCLLDSAAFHFLGLSTLVGLGGIMSTQWALDTGRFQWFAFGLRLFWPVVLIVVLELRAWARSHDRFEAPPRSAIGDETVRTAGVTPKVEPEAIHEDAPVAPRDGLKGILHDLRSPLTVVRAYTELMEEHARKGEPPAPQHLENLHAEIELMESLLDVEGESRAARPRRRRRERFDLVKLLGSLASTYRLAHGNRLRIEFIAESPELPVMADPLSVQRAFRNVLDNAVRYTPPGGQVRIRAVGDGSQACVVISDTGVGMSSGEQQRAFEFSFRGEAARVSGASGSGLGLGLTRELLEPQGGEVTLASEPGRGSDVTIVLPMMREAQA